MQEPAIGIARRDGLAHTRAELKARAMYRAG